MAQIIIDALQHDDVGANFIQKLFERRDFRVFSALDIAQQQAGAFARQLGVEGRDAQCFGLGYRNGADQGQHQNYEDAAQAGWKPPLLSASASA